MSDAKERIQGTVKWFSNRKGFGFITTPEGQDIFVHQSTIYSEGYRTLDENWQVEFSIGHDDEGKAKAEHVTAIGGGPCSGPKRARRPRRARASPAGAVEGGGEGGGTGAGAGGGASGMGEGGGSGTSSGFVAREPQPIWHDGLSEDVKLALSDKHIPTSTGTIDVALHDDRIKLGTRGYASMARADGTLAEGTFESDADGVVTLEWQRAVNFTGHGHDDDGSWTLCPTLSNLVTDIRLTDPDVKAVGLEESMASLMGDHVTDPRPTLEANGFLMRRVVLTTKKRERG